MKVLFFTPAVDETRDLLGFIPTWIRELAGKIDTLYVITPDYNVDTKLPENVEVYGLNLAGLTNCGNTVRFLSRLWYYNNLMLWLVPRCDVIFCHMLPIFPIMVAPYAKFFRKPLITWYAHGHVSRSLKIALWVSDKMVTPSKDSLRLVSNKIIITGHGVNTDLFIPKPYQETHDDESIILSVGRLSSVKNYETLIDATGLMIENGYSAFKIIIVGGIPIASEKGYLYTLKGRVRRLNLENRFVFTGSVPFQDIYKYYEICDIFVSTSGTGSIDKTILEAMACGKPVIVCNREIGELLAPYDGMSVFTQSDKNELAAKLINMMDHKEIWQQIGNHNRDKVVEKHSVKHLISRLIQVFEGEVAKKRRSV